jgi:CHAD domain-containing protein
VSEAKTRVSVRKSRTITIAERGNFEKTEYGIEQDLPNQMSPDEGLRNLETIIDNLLTQKRPPSTEDKYDKLPWRQSLKKRQLSTIPVTSELPELAKDLYNKLKNTEKHVLRIGETTYKLSLYEETGTEFLQRWCKE